MIAIQKNMLRVSIATLLGGLALVPLHPQYAGAVTDTETRGASGTGPSHYSAPTSPEHALQSFDPLSSTAPAAPPTPANKVTATTGIGIPASITGTEGNYIVRRGDTLRIVAARLGVHHTYLAKLNGLSTQKKLVKGQSLRFDNRRIVPVHPLKDGILINIPDRTLYYFQDGVLTFSTSVALGTPVKTDQFIWQTPTGRFKIVNKAKDPTWTVPPSIQEEMRLSGKEIITTVPPGPQNPLGKYAMKTSLPGIMIHSTTKPWSINSYASHGCIRVFPDRMEQLFSLIKINTAGEIIYHPVKIAATPEGKILLEVHADIYNKSKGLLREATAIIRKYGVENQVDWEKVHTAIKKRNGIAVEISKAAPPTPVQIEGHIPAQADPHLPGGA